MIGVKEAENASSIDSTEAGMVIDERLHELNDHKGKDVRDSDNVMFDRFVQLSNDHIPIYTTEFGITTSFNPVCMKAASPIFVTELGMSIDVRLVKPVKAYPPILFTVFGMIVFGHP